MTRLLCYFALETASAYLCFKKIARSAVLLGVCAKQPRLHAADIVPLLNPLLAVPACAGVALTALSRLCGAGAIEAISGHRAAMSQLGLTLPGTLHAPAAATVQVAAIPATLYPVQVAGPLLPPHVALAESELLAALATAAFDMSHESAPEPTVFPTYRLLGLARLW
jgi:hypothetical protein